VPGWRRARSTACSSGSTCRIKPEDFLLHRGATNSLIDVPNVLVGHYSHPQVLRGATAILTPKGAMASVSVRGSNSGTINTDALAPTAVDSTVYGISLCGGSLYGLAAARGIMEWCQEHRIGLERRGIFLPGIPGAVIYDLGAVDPRVLPTSEWGYRAAQAASNEPFERGNVGAGCGGTAGKGRGTLPVKGGLGTASLALPEGIIVGALAVVNSMGSPVDPISRKLYARDGGHDRPYYFRPNVYQEESSGKGNTTLGVIATNCILDTPQLAKIADIAHNGFARVIRPMHTMLDGDTIFTLSVTGEDEKLPEHEALFQVTDMIGAAGADAMVLALVDAFMQAESIPGFPACREILEQ
jgi:L-aminopeptidase/D-esterase-like protein